MWSLPSYKLHQYAWSTHCESESLEKNQPVFLQILGVNGLTLEHVCESVRSMHVCKIVPEASSLDKSKEYG